MPDDDRVRALQERIDDLKRRLPAHSIPPAMMQELDDLEEALQQARKDQQEGSEETSVA